MAAWPVLRKRIAAAIATRTRDEWGELAAGTDACIAPILTPRKALEHPHHREREIFFRVDDALHPAPAPRLSRTVPDRPTPAPMVGSNAHAVLADWGLSDAETAAHEGAGAFGSGR